MMFRVRLVKRMRWAVYAGLSCGLASWPATEALRAAEATPPDPALMWDLTDLYPTVEAWVSAHERVTAQAETLMSYRGTLHQGSARLLQVLDTMSVIRREAFRLASYANLRADEDLRIASNQERRQQVQTLMTRIRENTAWVVPELLALGGDRVRGFIAEQPELEARFDHYLDDVLRAAPHTLGEEAERLLASAGSVLVQPNNIYDQIADAELPFPRLTLSDGTEVVLDQAAYSRYREVPDRADRQRVFEAFWGKWKEFEGTFGAVLNTHLQGQVFSARARRHSSALAASLFADNMPEAVYRRLVSEANAALPVLHRYLRLRKRLLGITDELRYHDIYPPMFRLDAEPRFDIEASRQVTLAALRPLGEPYLQHLRRGFAGRWTHVLPAPGKASGAYMNGSAYDVHPYLLLNHNDSYGSLSTFAHEWGHAAHSMLANASQPFEKAGYSTFTAETASIANEMLLTEHVVRTAGSVRERIFYLGEALESIRATFFRQTQFAEFELAVHEEVEQGRPLSGARLTELYCGILRRYHGEAEGVMRIDPLYCIEWAFIPHFYYDFYVYQYATSMAGAALLVDGILEQGEAGRQRFLDLLRAGGSDYPYPLYRAAGIDMAGPEPYRALAGRMTRIMDEIERLEEELP